MGKRKLSVEELVKRISDKESALERFLEEKKQEQERHKKNLKNINRKINRARKAIKDYTEEKNKIEAIGLVAVINAKGMKAEEIEKALKNNNTSAIADEIRAGEMRKAEQARKEAEKKKTLEEARKEENKDITEEKAVEVAKEESIEEVKEEAIKAAEENKKKRGIFGRK